MGDVQGPPLAAAFAPHICCADLPLSSSAVVFFGLCLRFAASIGGLSNLHCYFWFSFPMTLFNTLN